VDVVPSARWVSAAAAETKRRRHHSAVTSPHLSLSLSLRLSALIYSYSGRRCAQLHARPQISWPMISLSISQEIGCWEDRLRNGGKRVGC